MKTPGRWFVDERVRARYAPEDRDHLSRRWASGLREMAARRGPSSRAEAIADDLRARSAEFGALWDLAEVGVRPREIKRFAHPEVGALELFCQTLLDVDTGHSLLVESLLSRAAARRGRSPASARAAAPHRAGP